MVYDCRKLAIGSVETDDDKQSGESINLNECEMLSS